jgi:hypothetical protein
MHACKQYKIIHEDSQCCTLVVLSASSEEGMHHGHAGNLVRANRGQIISTRSADRLAARMCAWEMTRAGGMNLRGGINGRCVRVLIAQYVNATVHADYPCVHAR